MKVLVMWETSAEQTLAENLVAVLKKIGAMLVYGKINKDGVLLEDWKSKPKVTMECLATQSPSMQPKPGDTINLGSYTMEMPYVDGYGYYAGPGFTEPVQPMTRTLSVTRELMRDLVRMFPDSGSTAKAIDKTKKTKPVVPQPKTTKTGVTVRQLDMWEEDEHE